MNVATVRQSILLAVYEAGRVCYCTAAHSDGRRQSDLAAALNSLLRLLVDISVALRLDLEKVCVAKMKLNHAKYPNKLCGAIIQKYTVHSGSTGILRSNQTISPWVEESVARPKWTEQFYGMGLASITAMSTTFVKTRQWEIHDTPTNLALALGSEVGELADVLAWSGDCIPEDDKERCLDALAQELADVTIILVRLASHTKARLIPDMEMAHKQLHE